MAETKQQADKAGRLAGLVPYLVLSCLVNLVLGLGLVLVSIERTDLGYEVRRLEGEVKVRADHVNKLEVERERLLSPYALEKKAAEFGMRPARPGQIRRMGDPGPQTRQ